MAFQLPFVSQAYRYKHGYGRQTAQGFKIYVNQQTEAAANKLTGNTDIHTTGTVKITNSILQ